MSNYNHFGVEVSHNLKMNLTKSRIYFDKISYHPVLRFKAVISRFSIFTLLMPQTSATMK